ncbi:MAG: hypothetical protein Kow0031_14460 [Anaerolineae bacterium]
MNTLALPEYILWQHSATKITPLKLQKLLYYVKAWGLVADKELYQGQFYRWPHGPVNPEVYHAYKQYGRTPIPAPAVPSTLPTGEEQALIDFILATYLPFSATSLSAMTHKEAPWQQTPDQALIDPDLMRLYYGQQAFAQNFNPFDPVQRPYYPLQSDAWHAFVLDMSDEDAQRHTKIESYEQYLTYLKQAQADVTDLEQTLSDLIDR